MNKIKFEAQLREKLSILKTAEIDEIVAEYIQHIEMKEAEGIAEEKAISDFGDLDALVTDILDAYKIDTSHDRFEDFGETVKRYLNIILNYINDIANSLINLSGKEIILLIVEFVIVLFILGGVSVVIDILGSGFLRLFNYFPHFIYRTLSFIIRFLESVVNLTVSISILYWFASERVIIEDVKNTDDNFNSKKTRPIKSARPSNKSKKVKDNSFIEGVIKFNIVFFKFIGVIILIPMIVFGVFLGLGLVIVLYNTILGIGSIGISLILLGVFIMYFYIVVLGINLVSGGSYEKSNNSI